MPTITPENNPARPVLASIVEAMKAYRTPNDSEQEAVTIDGQEYTDPDDIYEMLGEMPLSLEVRSGWHDPHCPDDGDRCPAEYRLLMRWGGPAVQITGEVSYGQPTKAKIQGQDWSQPWTDLPLTDEEQDWLDAFVDCVVGLE